MPQSDALKRFLTGTPTKSFRTLAARGIFPLPTNEILQLLVHLLKDPEAEVSEQASRTLQEWPEGEILEQIEQPTCDPSVLDYFALARPSEHLQLAIIHNLATPGSTIAVLAARVPASHLETILDNRVRLLQFPEILKSAKRNPKITPTVIRLVQEIESEFFSGKKGEYRVEEPPTEAPPEVEPLEAEPELPLEDLVLEGLPIDAEAREQALLERLAKMSVKEKVRIALMGTREERGILIRDSNKQIARSVLKSPKLSDNEIETFSAMRNISDEILREIGSNREWTHRYTVAQNLVKNPRTPPLISQRLIHRLHAKDLVLISRDRGVPEPVRRTAQRTLSQRAPQR